MKKNKFIWKKIVFVSMSLSALLLLFTPPLPAIQLDTKGFEISFDSTLTMGGSIRVEERNYDLVGKCNQKEFYEDVGIKNDPTSTADDLAFHNSLGRKFNPRGAWDANGDDGNLNFDTGFFSQIAKGSHSFNIRKENYGAFVRASWLVDFYLLNESDSMRTDLEANNEIKNNHIQAFEVLDYFVFSNFTVFDKSVSFRLGAQAINWGESTFMQHGISVASPIDASKIRVAGAELKDALIPQGSIWANMRMTRSIGFEGYYQYEWSETKLDSPGTYFSKDDYAGPGATALQLHFTQVPDHHVAGDNDLINTKYFIADRRPDAEAKDNGQFGLKLSWLSEALNYTEFGLYYANYHSHTPYANLIGMKSLSDPVIGYRLVYPEDIDLYGLSFNTDFFWGIACGGEIAYRRDEPFAVDVQELAFKAIGAGGVADLNAISQLTPEQGWKSSYSPGDEIKGYILRDSINYNISFTKLFFNRFGFDETATLLEVGALRILDMPNHDELRLETPGTDRSGNPGRDGVGLWKNNSLLESEGYQPNSDFCDDFSWGYVLLVKGTRNNMFRGVNVSPIFILKHDVSGTAPYSSSLFVEGRKQIDLMVNFAWKQNIWSVDVGYTLFMGGSGSSGTSNLLEDRDYVSFNLKYSI